MTQANMAALAGLSVKTIGKIERGVGNLEEKTVKDLGKAMGLGDVETDRLWTAVADRAAETTVARPPRPPRKGKTIYFLMPSLRNSQFWNGVLSAAIDEVCSVEHTEAPGQQPVTVRPTYGITPMCHRESLGRLRAFLDFAWEHRGDVAAVVVAPPCGLRGESLKLVRTIDERLAEFIAKRVPCIVVDRHLPMPGEGEVEENKEAEKNAEEQAGNTRKYPAGVVWIGPADTAGGHLVADAVMLALQQCQREPNRIAVIIDDLRLTPQKRRLDALRERFAAQGVILNPEFLGTGHVGTGPSDPGHPNHWGIIDEIERILRYKPDVVIAGSSNIATHTYVIAQRRRQARAANRSDKNYMPAVVSMDGAGQGSGITPPLAHMTYLPADLSARIIECLTQWDWDASPVLGEEELLNVKFAESGALDEAVDALPPYTTPT